MPSPHSPRRSETRASSRGARAPSSPDRLAPIETQPPRPSEPTDATHSDDHVRDHGPRSGKPGNSITVIDIGKLSVIRTIELREDQRPHGMKFLPGDSLVAVTSETSKSVILVDVRSGALVKRLPTNGRATHMLALSAKGDRM